jgi:hypothetical protein
MARKNWTTFTNTLRPGVITFRTFTFQHLLTLAAQTALHDATWPALSAWLETKIARVTSGR